MDFTIIPVAISIVFFVLAMIQGTRKNGSGSMQQIGLFITAAALMYLGINYMLVPAQPIQYNTSNIIITQGSTITTIQASNTVVNTGLNPQAEDVYIYETSAWFYVVICMVFCLAGILSRFGG
jgi:hypothetical protein